jgi:hypothetical protein
MWPGATPTPGWQTGDVQNSRIGPVRASAPDGDAAHGWKAFLPALAMASTGLVALAMAWASPARGGDQYLVIASPAATRGQTLGIIFSAGGRLVGEGRLANVALASSSDPAFAAKLRKAGAWIATGAPQDGGCLGLLTGEDARP